VFLTLITADGPGMMHVTGMVGYHGKHGCRLYCGMQGRREHHGTHYFPALLKPLNYNVLGCTHGDIDVKNLPVPSHEWYHKNLCIVISSSNNSQYCARHLETGISKPSIFSGLDLSSTLGLPVTRFWTDLVPYCIITKSGPFWSGLCLDLPMQTFHT